MASSYALDVNELVRRMGVLLKKTPNVVRHGKKGDNTPYFIEGDWSVDATKAERDGFAFTSFEECFPVIVRDSGRRWKKIEHDPLFPPTTGSHSLISFLGYGDDSIIFYSRSKCAPRDTHMRPENAGSRMSNVDLGASLPHNIVYQIRSFPHRIVVNRLHEGFRGAPFYGVDLDLHRVYQTCFLSYESDLI